MKKIIISIILLVFVSSFALAQSQYTEIIYLKNGSVIRGIIIESIPNKSVKIQTKDGTIFFYNIDEVDKITKEISDDSFSDKNDSKVVSQTQSGSLFIGGEIYYSNVSTKYNYSLNQFMFSPRIGFFVIDNLLLGVTLAYANVSDNSSSQDQFIIGPILRYYFGSGPSKPFTYLIFGYETQKNNNSTALGMGLGYNIAISRNVALSPVIQYDFVAPKGGDLGDIKEFYVGIGISTFIF